MRTVTTKGSPVPVEGDELHAGDKAPDFELKQATANGIVPCTLADYAGKTLILSVTPSIETSVCATMAKRFNEEASSLPDSVKVLNVSTDLPQAQARFGEEAGANKIEFASDHLETSFGRAYGVLIPPLRQLARSVFVVDPSGMIAYAEYVSEIVDLPDFDAAFAAARKAANVLS
ncbi:MAG: thiol peroxidase [Armatimonadetes bacterium]|nr:thiol peroxidase [Armatimonadota bacterium]